MRVLKLVKSVRFWVALVLLGNLRGIFQATPAQFNWWFSLVVGGGAIILLVSVVYDVWLGTEHRPTHVNHRGYLH
ncbi:hypothetical protein [Levilactobacillus zymae]|uniref:hypothetical protein n=1 Tax=Levilactobacillus zymae TaxID=267363 RepID=UPI0028B7CC26|nr:hypothetical protein [Levilactobacillus zymae]MDT6981529.1 hypothetical protein [Levilactobacillus zymae]